MKLKGRAAKSTSWRCIFVVTMHRKATKKIGLPVAFRLWMVMEVALGCCRQRSAKPFQPLLQIHPNTISGHAGAVFCTWRMTHSSTPGFQIHFRNRSFATSNVHLFHHPEVSSIKYTVHNCCSLLPVLYKIDSVCKGWAPLANGK